MGRKAAPAQAPNCIYLDNAATTALDRRVLDSMYGIMAQGHSGNAHARHHVFGAAAHNTVEAARRQVAEAIGAHRKERSGTAATPPIRELGEIVFTSGATEANNLAIKGVAAHLKSIGKTHLVTSAVEHASVLAPLKALAKEGFELTLLSVKPCGMIEAEMIERALRPDTGLVCVQAVNNEVGVIQPIEEIALMLSGRDVLFHCDAAQALGKIDFDVAVGVDFASLSSHKVYGPQGVGALYVRAERKQLLAAVNHGGGQEYGLRSGTLPSALCAGFGRACTLIEDDSRHLRGLRSAFLNRIAWLKPIVYGHSHPQWNVP